MIEATATDLCTYPRPFDAELGAVIITGGADDDWLDSPRCPWFAVVNAAAGCPFGTFGFPDGAARDRGIEVLKRRGYTHFVEYLDVYPGFQFAVLAGGPLGDPFTTWHGKSVRFPIYGKPALTGRLDSKEWRHLA